MLDSLAEESGDPMKINVAGADLPAVLVLDARESLPDPPSSGCHGFHDWARDLGGADQHVSLIDVILQGATDRAVVVTEIGARVVGEAPADPEGFVVMCLPQGEAPVRNLTLDLDATTAAAVYRNEDGASGPLALTLSRGETEVLKIEARTTSDVILEWFLTFVVTVDGKDRTIEVRDGEEPFRTTGAELEEEREWFDGWSTAGLSE